jgi:DNA-binding NarL/FixJ family response regulator
LLFWSRGRSNKAISRELDLAEQTVKTHVSAVLRILNVASRTQAVIAVGELGLDLKRFRKRLVGGGTP